MNKKGALLLISTLLLTSFYVALKPASANTLTENSWVSRAPMHQARGGLGVATLNGKIYAIGGSIASGPYPPDFFAGGFVGTNEEYDPATDTWTTKASMPTPRDYFAIAAYQNKIYCIGGGIGFSTEERSGFHSLITCGINEVYNTVTDTWATKKPMPNATIGEGDQAHVINRTVYKQQAQVVNGKIYVIGPAFTYVYDPANDSWTSKTRMPTPNPGCSVKSVVLNNKIIVIGEYSSGFLKTEQKVLIYDPENDTWSQCKSDPTIVVAGAAGATVGAKAPQKIYVLGVVSENPRPTPVNQVYDPKTDTWATANAMTTNRQDFAVVVVNDKLYAIGGYTDSSYHITPIGFNEQYIPIGYSTPPEMKVVSPSNQTYNESSVSLVFNVDKPVNWTGYSLDGQENVTIAGNATLTELSDGLHNITIYAKGQFENIGSSETVTFNITSEPFPTASVTVASTASTAVVCLGIALYLRKRKSQRLPP